MTMNKSEYFVIRMYYLFGFLVLHVTFFLLETASLINCFIAHLVPKMRMIAMNSIFIFFAS